MKGIILAALLAFSAGASADYIEKDSQFIYVNTPWQQVFLDDIEAQQILKVGINVFKNYMVDMADKNLLPGDIKTFKDLKVVEKMEEDLDKALLTINEWTAKAKDKIPFRWDFKAAAPVGFFIKVGLKGYLNLKIGAGMSASIGAVFVPIQRTVISRETLEVVRVYNTVDVDFVIWGAPSAGVGLSTGPKAQPRVGIGAIWDLDQELDDASDFNGGGLGVTSTITLSSLRFNVKAGLVNSLSLNGFVDLAFASISWIPSIPGVSALDAGADIHGSANIIIPMETALDYAGSHLEGIMKKEMGKFEGLIKKETEKILDQIIEGSKIIEVDVEEAIEEANTLP